MQKTFCLRQHLRKEIGKVDEYEAQLKLDNTNVVVVFVALFNFD